MFDTKRIKIKLDKNIHLLKTFDTLTVTGTNMSLYHLAIKDLSNCCDLNSPLTSSTSIFQSIDFLDNFSVWCFEGLEQGFLTSLRFLKSKKE